MFKLYNCDAEYENKNVNDNLEMKRKEKRKKEKKKKEKRNPWQRGQCIENKSSAWFEVENWSNCLQ